MNPYLVSLSRNEQTEEDLWCCSRECMRLTLERVGAIPRNGGLMVGAGTFTNVGGYDVSYGAWPGGAETDYDVYCSNGECQELLWKGLAP